MCWVALTAPVTTHQIHNAEQLGEWSLSYLAQSYSTVCRRCLLPWTLTMCSPRFPKMVRALYPDNQAALNIHRWPPLW